MTQIRRQAGKTAVESHPIHYSLLLPRPATLLLVALAISSFSIIYIIHLTNDEQQPVQLGTDHPPLVRRNKMDPISKNLSKTVLVDHHDTNTNTMVKIDSKHSAMNPLDVWESLIKSSSSSNNKDEKKQTVIEVGVHSPKQCIDAAELGYDTHCFEPSPLSYTRIERGVEKQTSPQTRDLVHIYNTAVGATSGQTIPFHSTGGTGDHVGEYDMWQMKKKFERTSDADLKKRGTIVQVPTVRLDDFIAGDSIDGEKVFLLKVDTQGFEPSIFQGLETTIQGASVDYIIFEFWPRGMDLLSDTSNECIGHKVLDQLLAAGYTLYALKVESHPKAPLTGQTLKDEARTRPFTVQSTKKYCEWFFNLEDRYPSKAGEEQYKFGYWSDFLAVAPGVNLPDGMA